MEPTAYAAPAPWYKRKLVWAFLLVLILIPVGSYLYASYFRKSSPPPSPAPAASTKILEEENSPIAFDILKNPLVYEWWGAIEGVLVTWDKQSFVLEKDKNQIRIWLDLTPNTTGTKFFHQEETRLGPEAKDTKIEEIPIDSYLRGDAFIHKTNKNKIVGSSFVILKHVIRNLN